MSGDHAEELGDRGGVGSAYANIGNAHDTFRQLPGGFAVSPEGSADSRRVRG